MFRTTTRALFFPAALNSFPTSQHSQLIIPSDADGVEEKKIVQMCAKHKACPLLPFQNRRLLSHSQNARQLIFKLLPFCHFAFQPYTAVGCGETFLHFGSLPDHFPIDRIALNENVLI